MKKHKCRLKNYCVIVNYTYEGYNGYDNASSVEYDIQAINEIVAENKAIKMLDNYMHFVDSDITELDNFKTRKVKEIFEDE